MSNTSRANKQKRADEARPETGSVPGFAVVDTIAVQRGVVSGIGVSPDGTRLMVTHYGDDSFSLINTADSADAQTVIDIEEPFAIAVSDTPHSRGYVSTVSTAYDSIVAFDMDANRVVATHPVVHSVTDLAVSPDGRRVYASRSSANGADIAILDTTTGKEDAIGLATSPGSTAGCVRVSPDGRRLYAAVNGPCAAELVVIDAHNPRVLNTIEIGSPIRDIALSRDGATAYVGSCGPDFGAVIDVVDVGDGRNASVANTYKIGEIAGFLTQLVMSHDGERAYLVGETGVTVLSTSTHDVIGNIMVGAQPSCATESPDGSRLYIADYAGAITVLTVASSAVSTEALTPDEIPTAPHQWAISNLLGLEPSLA